MRSQIIFRDDDIGFSHTAHAGELVMDSERIYNDFVKVDSLFIKYRVTHTIAVKAHELEKAKKIVDYIKKHPHIDIQLHGWDHLDYVENVNVLKDHLKLGCDKLKKVFGKSPTVFYPPYNKVDDRVIGIVNDFGLKISYEKMSLSGYLRGQEKDVINFHYWADECKDLEAALIKYTSK